jgi:hypothetical protein
LGVDVGVALEWAAFAMVVVYSQSMPSGPMNKEQLFYCNQEKKLKNCVVLLTIFSLEKVVDKKNLVQIK